MKIKFFYSSIYDLVLTEYEGKRFRKDQIKEVENYIQKLKRKWQKYETPIFNFLFKILKPARKEKEIICYVVKNFKFSAISHPLTLKMNLSFDEAIFNLIHEIIHILLVQKEFRKIFLNLKKKFPNEKPEIILHLYVNLIQLQVLKKFFKKKKVENFFEKCKRLKRTGKTWKIVLEKEKDLLNFLKCNA